MEFESTAFDRTTGKKLSLSMTPIDGNIHRWTGELTSGFRNNTSGGKYHIETGDGTRFYPFKVDSGSDIELLVQNEASSHQLEFTPVSEVEQRDATSFNLSLPPLRVLELCIEYLQSGLTPDLIDDIENTFDKAEQHRNLFEFISNARKCLRYTDFIGLLDDVAEENETAKLWLADTKEPFFKNIAIGVKAGHQFPIASFNQLKERITEYESTPHLKEVGLEEVIARLLDDAAEDPKQTIAEMTNFEIPFDEFIGRLEEVYVVQLLAASVNDGIDIPDRELVEAYFEVNEPSRGGPFALLRRVPQKHSHTPADSRITG